LSDSRSVELARQQSYYGDSERLALKYVEEDLGQQ
jgi:hypothetical protein